MTAFVAFCVAWPLAYAALTRGPNILIGALLGDSYHYLAIARKALLSGIYTYDGVHVTNGFHPLWQYAIRGVFELLGLQTHEAQAVALALMALLAVTAGAVLTALAIARMTGTPLLGLLVVPGVFYLVIGVHVRTLSIWAALDGMESAFSMLFGGIFFLTMSRWIGKASALDFDLSGASRAIGLVLPWLILSRLDDVFILPGFVLGVALMAGPLRDRLAAALWLTFPSAIAVAAYMAYNKVTAGALMPLSGGTKAGFVAPLALYMTAATHFMPVLDLKTWLTHSASDGRTVALNSFRFIEVFYPMVPAFIAIMAALRFKQRSGLFLFTTAIAVYILLKCGYNFLFVHPWHQAGWYYIFIMLCVTVLGALAVARPWAAAEAFPMVRNSVVVIYGAVALIGGSQYYANLVYPAPDGEVANFWSRKDLIREQLVKAGIHGVINVDDGITAFLLDLPMMHGFGFATDVQAQKAHRAGKMLSLGLERKINGLVGFGYMTSGNAPSTDREIREFLKTGLAMQTLSAEVDQFEFSLAYYDPVLKLPFFRFERIVPAPIR